MQIGFGLSLTLPRGVTSLLAGLAELSHYYGTGPGQIPMDLRLDDPAKMTLSGSLIQSVQNDGGAGASFNATATESLAPLLHANPASADFAEDRLQYLTLANDCNLNGVHMVVPALVPAVENLHYLAGQMERNNDYVALSLARASGNVVYLRLRITGTQTIYESADFTVPIGQWLLLEARVQGDKYSVYLNGQLISTVTCDPTANYLIDSIGCAGSSTSNRWKGRIGRIVSVVCDPANTAANPEPAVLLARQALADQYGVTL